MDEDKVPHAVDVIVGARVRAARVSLGLSQAALAERVGLSFQQVQKYERGSNRIAASRLVQLAKGLDLPPADFLSGLDDGSSPGKDFSFFNAPGAMELLLAYSGLPHREQRAVLRLARDLAGEIEAAEDASL